jgi:hypothetical protein
MFAMPSGKSAVKPGEAGVRDRAEAAQVEVPAVVLGQAARAAGRCTSSRSSLRGTPMISPTFGTKTSIARTVRSSSWRL